MTTTTMEPSQTLAGYIDRLRELIPARTLGLYVLAIGLVSSLAATPRKSRRNLDGSCWSWWLGAR